MNFLDSNSLRPQHRAGRYALWGLLLLSSAAPRILAALLLPNEEGDPYSYLQAIQIMRATMVAGTFSISELFGFWLPMYQFICAVISSLVGHPLYVAKLVSAVCGTGVCLLVFGVSLELTANRLLSLLAFALIALNPIHVMYSAFSMTDVPHSLLVMSSLYFAVKNRWVLASIAVAVGGFMRPESWIFIGLLPALQWSLRRRVSLTGLLVALSSPLLWIYISWAATGEPLEYFKVRNDYIAEFLSNNPGLQSFSPSVVAIDLRTLFYSSGPAVIIAGMIAAWLLIKPAVGQPNQRQPISTAVVVTVAYFFSDLGFLLLAYFTKNQPTIFARYCLGVYALGLPLLAWIFLAARKWKRGGVLAATLATLCFVQFVFQFRDGFSFLGQVSQKRIVAKYLRDNFRPGSGLKVFCDDDTVKTLAGIPAETFVSSSGSPADSKAFLEHLKETRVEFLVYERRDNSAVVTLFEDLEEGRMKKLFRPVSPTSVDIRLYRTAF